MSPFFLILPLYWVFQMIVLMFVALFSAVTGNYYAAVPRDGGDSGTIVYEEATKPNETGMLRIEFADGEAFAVARRALRVIAADESLLLPGRSARDAVVSARLQSETGARLHCEFGWPAPTEAVVGTCRSQDGRWFDVARRDHGLNSSGPGG